MSDRPMRTPRRTALPGFAAPPAPATATRSASTPTQAPPPSAEPPALLDLSDGPTRQICFYAPDAVRRHLARLVFELDQQGYRTTQSELLVALVCSGPASAPPARRLVVTLRRAGAGS